jgi:CubicO group peptidase (beta-lactamase class C family)
MGFGPYHWYQNPVDGMVHTGGGLRLLPRDLARFGKLYLAGGDWHGTRLISEDWVAASEKLRVPVGQNGYGYLWWMKSLNGVAGHYPSRTDVPYGWGYAGQHVFVSPDLDMVVVVNAWNADGSTRGPSLFDAVVQAVKR